MGRGAQGVEHQKNQFPEDRHDEKRGRYSNDVPERSWLRGGGEGHRPNMDRGKLDPSSVPPKAATGLKATGRDIPKSPFSAAHKTYSE
jgi:hypothetical protein